MIRTYTSLSSLPLAMKCQASQALPVVRSIGSADKIGSALHEHGCDRARLGMDGALERLDQIAELFDLGEEERGIFIARARGFNFNPPRGSVAELALCYLEDGSVVPVKGGRGSYENLPDGALLPGQIDLFWAEPEPLFIENGRPRCPPNSILWCVDYKTGSENYVDPVEKNAQLLGGALLTARYTGARAVMPAVCFWRKGDGIWDAPESYIDAAGIDLLEKIVRSTLFKVREQREAAAAGRPLSFVVGNHCTFCNSQIYCSAKMAAIKRYLDDPAPLAPSALTFEQVQAIAELQPSFSRFAENAKEALEAWTVANGRPIPLKDGRVWGPYPHEKSVLDPDKAVAALAEEIGNEAAAAALVRSVTKSKIDELIKESHAAKGIKRQGAPTMRRVMGALAAAGGVKKVTETWFGAHARNEADENALARGVEARPALPAAPGAVIDAELVE